MNVDLEARLRRLMLFRVVMVTTLLFIATYVESVSETLREVNPLYFVIAATYVLTVAYALALRFLPRRAPQVYAQVAGDLLIITALVHVSGGVRTGFLRRAAEHPQRIRVLDASPSAEHVASAALVALAAYRKDLP